MTPIDPQLQQALDGERDPGTLPPELREAYARLVRAATLLRAAPPATQSVADRVMEEIRRAPAPAAANAPGPARALRRLAAWFARPRAITLRLRPFWPLALAGTVAAVLLVREEQQVAPGVEEGIAQFVGHFPGAHSVEVVGSFNDWRRGDLALRDDDHDGIWHGAVVLPAGQHEYMFVVDGERWVPDPLAGRYVDDGFGRSNALLIVRSP